jgi:hypothetical protein
VDECSGVQPSYDVEVFHDGKGKCYFHDGWPKFFADYGLREGWSLIFSRRHGCGDPGLPPRIPVMHKIHDPRKTFVNPHNRVGSLDYNIHYITSSQSLT